jgi:hypothetical protein
MQPFLDACALPGATTILAGEDDMALPVTVPFSFVLWEYVGSDAWISSNGTFGGGTDARYDFSPSCPMPDMFNNPPNSVAVFQDDLRARTGVCYATVGFAPNRQFVVTWNDMQFFSDPSAHLTFSLMLSEGTNNIDIVYRTMTGGGTRSSGDAAGIGIINGDSTRAVQFSCRTGSVASGSAIRFTPM